MEVRGEYMAVNKIEVETTGIKRALKKFNTFSAISQYIWNGFDANATTIKVDLIKNQFNGLNDSFKQQKKVLENALKNNAYDLIATQGQNLTASVVHGIQPLMDKLVAKRSDINPFSSFKNFGVWTKYTSMIAGVY